MNSNANLYHIYGTIEYTATVDPETGETSYTLNETTYDDAEFTSSDIRADLSNSIPCFVMKHIKNYDELPVGVKLMGISEISLTNNLCSFPDYVYCAFDDLYIDITENGEVFED